MPQQQLVEIARALGADAKVLIFDEPTASLSEEDTQNLFRVIRELQGRGVGIIYISHRLEELMLSPTGSPFCGTGRRSGRVKWPGSAARN